MSEVSKMRAKRTRAVTQDAVLARDVKEIRRRLKRAKTSYRQLVTDLVEIGKRLERDKERVGYGGWMRWLNRNFKMSVDSAANYITLAEFSRDPGFRTVRNLLPLRVLYQLARMSPDLREAAIERAEAGEVILPSTEKRLPSQSRSLTLEVVTTTETVAVPMYVKKEEPEPARTLVPARGERSPQLADIINGAIARLVDHIGDKYETADDVAHILDRVPRDELLVRIEKITGFFELLQEALGVKARPPSTARPPEMPEPGDDESMQPGNKTKH